MRPKASRERREWDVEYRPWDEFLAWFARAWDPGEHVAVVAPTGAGKTTFVRGVLSSRRYVLCLDEKGGDSTLSGFGYPRLGAWPGIKAMARKVEENERKHRPSRYIVGAKVIEPSDFAKLRTTTQAALRDAFTMGGWTIYSDEHQVLTDRRMMNLGAEADHHLIAARDKGISFVSSFQAPSWVTPSASRQATWMAVAYTRDVDSVNTMAERLGRNKAVVRGWVSQLPKYHWLICGRDPHIPPVITLPRKAPSVK